TGIPKILTDSSSRKWGIHLHGSRVRSISGNNGSIGQGTMVFQGFGDKCYRRGLLANGNIYTIYRLPCIVKFFLVQNGIHTYGSLSGLTVTDHQLPLTPTYWDHGIDRLDTRLQWLGYRLTENNPWRLSLQWQLKQLPGNWALTIYRSTQGVHNTAYNTFTHFNGGNGLGAFYNRSFLYVPGRA